jgi:hypothetical protein
MNDVIERETKSALICFTKERDTRLVRQRDRKKRRSDLFPNHLGVGGEQDMVPTHSRPHASTPHVSITVTTIDTMATSI